MDTTPEPQDYVLSISPAHADEAYAPDSSDMDDSDEEEEKTGSEGERLRNDVGGMVILDVDDELADDDVPLQRQTPGRYSLVSSAAAALTLALLVKQSIMLRLSAGWLKGIIT